MANIKKIQKLGFKYICGVDEAGRGPLAGPMSLGFFVVETSKYNEVFEPLLKAGLNDSKKIKEEKREKLFEIIRKSEGKFYNSMISAKEIDKRGIAKCMQILINKILNKIYRLNLENLQVKPVEIPRLNLCNKSQMSVENTYFLLDGAIKFPKEIFHEVIIRGDSKEPTIMAASIVAKVSRDRTMRKIAKKYPQYSFEIHKGYGTLKHRKAIKKFGPCEIHRKSFCKNI